jgi:predicted nucleic acid-binding protein
VALAYLVDTSVLTRLAQPSVRAAVEPLAARGEAGRTTISDLEVGFSARDEEDWARLSAALAEFGSVEITPADVHRALDVQRLLARRRLRGRKVPDLLVAAAAERAGLAVLHYDRDFDLIAGVTRQECRWIVDRGSIP